MEEMALDEELTSLNREDSEEANKTQEGMKWPQHLCAIIGMSNGHQDYK